MDLKPFPDLKPNLAARLARWMARGTRGKRRPVRTTLFALLLIGWLALTGPGSFWASDETILWRKMLDAIYGPFTFLAPQDGYANNDQKVFDPYHLLRVGRFFGAALPVIAILWLWLHTSRMAIVRRLTRWAREHIVIFARNGAADVIAARTSLSGACVVLIEAGVSQTRARALASAGVLVVHEDGEQTEAIAQAGANHAGYIVAWSNSDANSIADAVCASELLSGAGDEILVRVESAETQRALRHAPELLTSTTGRLRPVSLTITAVRGALRGDALVSEAQARQQSSVLVGVHGSSAALQVAAMIILRHNWSIDLGAPRVRHAQRDEADWAAWLEHHRTLFDHAHEVLQRSPEELFQRVNKRSLVEDASITRHIVDLGEDDATLRAAFNLASELAQSHRAPPAVQPILRDKLAAQALITQSKLRFERPILLSDDRSIADLIARIDDREAARIHLDYLAGSDGPQGAASVEWNQLAETFVHANRAAADHNAVKAYDIAKARARGDEEGALRERLARTEHDRWSIERLLDGWAPGPRSDDRLLHDNLVPWDELSDKVRSKDLLQIDKLLGLDQAKL